MPNFGDSAKTSDIEHVDWSTGTGGSRNNYTTVRFGSGSSQASQNSGDICRICHCESDPQNPLLTPCYCSGSLKYVHQACLQQWLTASETNACELCKFPFIMHTKIKPFNEWRSLDISGIERRRLCCSLLFHCAAALCVIWSLCVLIERAADDVERGLIDWPFWTKLGVVTIGMTGGIVFMYIQCKAYLHLCHRWKARNRILLIQNVPEKVHPLSPPSPVVQQRTRRGGSLDDMHPTDRDRTSVNANAAVEIVDSMGSSTLLSSYGYVHAAGGAHATDGDIDELRGAGGSMHRHHHHHSLRHHPHHHQHRHMLSSQQDTLPHSDIDADSLATQTSSSSAIGVHSSLLHQSHHHQQQLAGTHQHPLGQMAVAANIECSQSQQNYERDWALDDVVSQISSFRPCPQGSGSMTPFHDSIHNVLEHSEECSSRDSRQNLSTGAVSSEMGREHALQLSNLSGSGENKAPSIDSGASTAVANGLGGFVYRPHNKRYSNSSIFLENRDILNDDADDLSFRHASIIRTALDKTISGGGGGGGDASADGGSNSLGRSCSDVSAGNVSLNSEQLEKFLDKDKRRYSDTKLMSIVDHDRDLEACEPMLSTNDAGTCKMEYVNVIPRQPTETLSPPVTAQSVLGMNVPLSQLTPPVHYNNIGQQQRQSAFKQMHRSMHTVEMGEEIAQQMAKNQNQNQNQNHSQSQSQSQSQCTATASTSQHNSGRAIFKSLPNLNSSCESLIKK